MSVGSVRAIVVNSHGSQTAFFFLYLGQRKCKKWSSNARLVIEVVELQ